MLYVFPRDSVFLPCDHGLDFWHHQLIMWEFNLHCINQSINTYQIIPQQPPTASPINTVVYLHSNPTPSFSFSFFHLTYSRWTSSLPSCLWSQRIFPSLPGSRLTIFLSRCKFSTLTTRQPMVEFYLLTFPRFPLRKKEHKSYFGKNRTHDFFRTSRCAAYLLDHSGDERHYYIYIEHTVIRLRLLLRL